MQRVLGSWTSELYGRSTNSRCPAARLAVRTCRLVYTAICSINSIDSPERTPENTLCYSVVRTMFVAHTATTASPSTTDEDGRSTYDVSKANVAAEGHNGGNSRQQVVTAPTSHRFCASKPEYQSLQCSENVPDCILRCEGDEDSGLEKDGGSNHEVFSSVRVASSRDDVQVRSLRGGIHSSSPCAFKETLILLIVTHEEGRRTADNESTVF